MSNQTAMTLNDGTTYESRYWAHINKLKGNMTQQQKGVAILSLYIETIKNPSVMKK